MVARLHRFVALLGITLALVGFTAGVSENALAQTPERAFTRANDTYKNADYKRAAQM